LGTFYPTFSTTDLTLIDECFDAAEAYYNNLGIQPPSVRAYAAGEFIPEYERELWLTGMAKSTKRSRNEYDLWDNPDVNGDEPAHKVLKVADETSVHTRAASLYSDASDDSDESDDSDDSSSSEMTDSPSALDLNSLNSINKVSSETASDAADVDDSTSYCSSESSIASDDTEAILELARTGRIDDLYPIDDVTPVRPNNLKPSFALDQILGSPVVSRIPEFLAAMEAANKELEAERAAGTLAGRCLEIDDVKDEADDTQYIEMNLGLGVLEERNGDTSTSSESESSNDASEEVMDKLMGNRKTKGEHDEQEKRVKIEEL